MRAEYQIVVRRWEAWCGGILLLALLAVTHHDVIFLGRSIVSTNYSNPLDWRLLPQNYGPDLVPHDEWTKRNLWPYANISDPGATWWQWEPSTQFLKQALRDGEWPFWDPYIAGGSPAMANLIPAFFFPPFVIVVLLGASNALLNAYFLFLIWFSSLLTFRLLRRHELGPLAAGGGAAMVMLCGATQQHIGTFIGQTTYCLPFTMYATRLFLDRPGARGAAWIAIAYAATALASFPPVLLAVFAVTTIYTLVGLCEHPAGTRVRAAGWWTCGILVALGLVAAYYGPALAARTASPQVSDNYKHAGIETMPLLHLYQILSPTLMGGVQTYLAPPIEAPGGADISYVGMVAVLLGLLASPRRQAKARTLVIACCVGIAAIVMKLLGVPPVQWIGTLPGLSEIHFAHYLGMPLGFLLSCLAAVGLHALQRGDLSPARAFAAAAIGVIVVESLWWAGESLGALSSQSSRYWIRDWRVLGTVTVLASFAALVGALRRHDGAARRAATIVLLLLAVAEGIYNAWFPNPARWSIFDHPVPFVRVLQQHAPSDRMFSFGAPNGNLNSAFRIFSMESLMAFNPPRAYTLYHRYAKALPGVFMRQSAAIPPEPVLDRSNIAVVGSNRAFGDIVNAAVARGYKTIFDDGFIVLFERPTLPRFFFGSAYRVVSTAEALDAIAAPNSREIIVEQAPGVPASPNLDTDPAVRVVAYHRNSVTLEVDAPRPGLVYASESYFEGWTALRNGSPVEILPANYAFRAVAVPAGLSRIEFRYWPPGLTAGLGVTGLSMMALIGLLAANRFTSLATSMASGRRTTSAVP